MELFRDELALRQGPNWGKITFERLQARERAEKLGQIDKTLPVKVVKAVDEHFDSAEDDNLPLDATEVIQTLNDDEQCYFFSQYNTCTHLIIRDWSHLSQFVLRCIGITMGDTLEILDVSNSAINSSHFDVLLVRLRKLRVLLCNKCPNLDGACMNLVATLCHETLRELFVSECHRFRDDPLLYISGGVSHNGPRLRNLSVIDLSNTPVNDIGILGIAKGCRKIEYLNLGNCSNITDVSMSVLPKFLTKLKVLNLSNDNQLSNKTLIKLGKYCPEMVSLNLCRLIRIDDKGLAQFSKGAKHVQALNISGCVKITETSIAELVRRCDGMLMLNVTGCPEVTSNGLNALIRGLHFVEPAISFIGFKPIDHHIDMKLNKQLHMIVAHEKHAAIQAEKIRRRDEAIKKEEYRELTDKSVRRIQRTMFQFSCRMRFYRMWMTRTRLEAAIAIQRLFRGIVGRSLAKLRREEHMKFLSLFRYAVMIQKLVRGHECRKRNRQVAKAMREMFRSREKEALHGIAVRIQSHCRRYLSLLRVFAWKEILHRRDNNETYAAIRIQVRSRIILTIKVMIVIR